KYHERIFHAPIGGVGHVRNTSQSVELDIVAASNATQYAQCTSAHLQSMLEFGRELVYSVVRQLQQTFHLLVILATLFDGMETMAQCRDKRAAPFTVTKQ